MYCNLVLNIISHYPQVIITIKLLVYDGRLKSSQLETTGYGQCIIEIITSKS